ncbi:MAG: hypothetical protein FWH42_02575 [Dehalococcoidia bacterium]|nr:hypothetical protein [Dehalococcoidia bacterium]
MSTNISAIIVVFVLGLLCGALAFWLNSRRLKTHAQPKTSPSEKSHLIPAFRISFVIAPATLAVFAIILSACVFGALPASIDYRFTSEGVGRNSMSSIIFVLVLSAIQVICAIIAWGTVSIIVRLSHNYFRDEAPLFKLDGFIMLMSNMVLLPQVILSYFMLDTYIYALWEKHLIPVTTFAFAVIIIGSLIILSTFIWLVSSARNSLNKQ